MKPCATNLPQLSEASTAVNEVAVAVSHVSESVALTKNKASHRIEGLDGLRGLAALVVVGGHLTAGLIALTGVYLFFILSSFLLTSQFLRWQRNDFLSWRHWAYYLQRRTLRIVPLFALVATISCITTMWAFSQLNGEGLPLTVPGSQLFKVLTFRAGPNVLWTVPVEFKFYLVLPVVALLLVVLLRKHFILCAASLLLAVVGCLSFFSPVSHSLQVWPYLSFFLTGSLVAVIHHQCRQETQSREATPVNRQAVRWSMEILAWGLLAGWFMTMPMPQRLLMGWNVDREAMLLAHPLFCVMFGLLLFATMHGRGLLRRIFETRLMKWMGAISFSLYLWHIGPIRLFDSIPGLHPHVAGLLAVLVSIGLASVSYWFFERPILNVSRNWLNPKARKAAADKQVLDTLPIVTNRLKLIQ